ncbi:MAG TPA: hypothetical protein PLW55_12415, partial [Leptospiraceae bacterium]|nr:hypothetical protein [Leptospiraceae bacterium]
MRGATFLQGIAFLFAAGIGCTPALPVSANLDETTALVAGIGLLPRSTTASATVITRVMVVLGNNTTTTNIYDPSTNMFSNGPTLTGSAAPGTIQFTIPSGTHSGKTLIVHGASSSMYDPATGSMVAGPAPSGTLGIGSAAFVVPAGGAQPGKVMIVHGGSLLTTSLYNPATHTMGAGAALGFGPTGGSFTMYIPTGTQGGKFMTMQAGAQRRAMFYDPVGDSYATSANQTTANVGGDAWAYLMTSGAN